MIDSVIGTRCKINSYSEVHSCILLEDVEVGRGARIRRCIIDKHVKIPNNDVIGYNRDDDAKRFHVTENGLVVIRKNLEVEPLKR